MSYLLKERVEQEGLDLDAVDNDARLLVLFQDVILAIYLLFHQTHWTDLTPESLLPIGKDLGDIAATVSLMRVRGSASLEELDSWQGIVTILPKARARLYEAVTIMRAEDFNSDEQSTRLSKKILDCQTMLWQVYGYFATS